MRVGPPGSPPHLAFKQPNLSPVFPTEKVYLEAWTHVLEKVRERKRVAPSRLIAHASSPDIPAPLLR